MRRAYIAAHALLLRDLLHGEALVGLTTQIEIFLVEQRHRRHIGWLLQALLEGIVQHLDRARVHTLGTADAVRRVRDDVDANLAQGWHVRPVFGTGRAPGD